MLKKTILSIIALMAVSTISAQEYVVIEPISKSYTLSLGPKAGVNYSLAKDPSNMMLGMGGAVGYQVGIAMNMHFGRRVAASPGGTGWLGLQLEALYANRALQTDGGDMSLSYYQVPLLLHIYLVPRLAVAVGPTFCGVLSAKPGQIDSNSWIVECGQLRSNDVMLTLGIDYKAKVGFTTSVRYNMGNSNLASNMQTKISTVEISVGWLFNLVK